MQLQVIVSICNEVIQLMTTHIAFLSFLAYIKLSQRFYKINLSNIMIYMFIYEAIYSSMLHYHYTS
jgi:hypothetical protein